MAIATIVDQVCAMQEQALILRCCVFMQVLQLNCETCVKKGLKCWHRALQLCIVAWTCPSLTDWDWTLLLSSNYLIAEPNRAWLASLPLPPCSSRVPTLKGRSPLIKWPSIILLEAPDLQPVQCYKAQIIAQLLLKLLLTCQEFSLNTAIYRLLGRKSSSIPTAASDRIGFQMWMLCNFWGSPASILAGEALHLHSHLEFVLFAAVDAYFGSVGLLTKLSSSASTLSCRSDEPPNHRQRIRLCYAAFTASNATRNCIAAFLPIWYE